MNLLLQRMSLDHQPLFDRTIPMGIIVITPDQFERQKDVISTIIRAAPQEGRTIYERATARGMLLADATERKR